MTTIYDYITVAIFCGIVVLFLQRSMAPPDQMDSMIAYFPPVLACAVANQLGNNGATIWAILMILATLGYILLVLKPFPLRRQ